MRVRQNSDASDLHRAPSTGAALSCGGDKATQKADIDLALRLTHDVQGLRMGKIKTSPYDVADDLATPEDCAAYLDACIEESEGDAPFIAKALGDIARAKGMTQVAQAPSWPNEPLDGPRCVAGVSSRCYTSCCHATVNALSRRPRRIALIQPPNRTMNDRPLNLAIFDAGLLKAPFFLALAPLLAPEVRCVYWSCRPLMRAYARSAGIPILPAGTVARATTDIDDDSLLEAIGSKDLAIHGRRGLARQRRLYAAIEHFLDAQAIDALLVWNGSNRRLSMAIHAARQRGLPVIHTEHGYFPGTMQVDLDGVNAASSLARLIRTGFARRPPDPTLDARLDKMIAALRGDVPTRAARNPVPPRFLDRRDARWMHTLLYRLRPLGLGMPLLPSYTDPALPPDGFVFYPLQVVHDSQLLLHSPVWGNDHGRVIAAVRDRLAAMSPPRSLVVKFHPHENRIAQIRLDALRRRFPDVTFVRQRTATELIRRAAVVVTINSSVGFEALALDKPLVVLGQAFYGVPALTEVAVDERELRDALHRALTRPVPTAERRAVLRACLADHFAAGSYWDHSEASLSAVAERIRALLADHPRPRRWGALFPSPSRSNTVADAA